MLPDGISLEHHRDRRGQRHRPWIRRLLLCAIAVLPLLALANVFGQHPTTSSIVTPTASLSVTAPSRLRGGDIFQVRVEVFAHREVGQVELVFDKGWWESMSVNSMVPEPTEESSDDGRVVLSYGKLAAGCSLVAWIYFQVNPTNVGERSENLELRNGSTPLAHIHRSMTVFP